MARIELETFRTALLTNAGASALRAFDAAHVRLTMSGVGWRGSQARAGKKATFWPWLLASGATPTGRVYPPLTFRTDGVVELPLQFMAKPGNYSSACWLEASVRAELVHRVNAAFGTRLGTKGRPTFPIVALLEPDALDQLQDIFVWAIDEHDRAASGASKRTALRRASEPVAVSVPAKSAPTTAHRSRVPSVPGGGRTDHEAALTRVVLDELALQGFETATEKRLGQRALDGLAWRGEGAPWSSEEVVIVETKQALTSCLIGQAVVAVAMARLRGVSKARAIVTYAEGNTELLQLLSSERLPENVEARHQPLLASGGRYRGEKGWSGVDAWLRSQGWPVQPQRLAHSLYPEDTVHVVRDSGGLVVVSSQAKLGRSGLGRAVCGRLLLGADRALVVVGKTATDLEAAAAALDVEVVVAG